MTLYPRYLKSYPNMHTSFPLHLAVHTLRNGYPAHRHDFLEFSFVTEGSGWEKINGVPHPMKPGTFTLVLPYHIHEIYTDPGATIVLYNCMFGLKLLSDGSDSGTPDRMLTQLDRSQTFAVFEGEELERVRGLMEDMLREYTGKERWRETMLRSRLLETLVRFDRHRHREHAPGSPSSIPQEKASRTVWPVVHYIHAHYGEELTLGNLAERFAISASRLSELIKMATGQTFVSFVNELRIRHACSLLATTTMSVSQIALEVGFGSYQTFSRSFRDVKQTSPREYRLGRN